MPLLARPAFAPPRWPGIRPPLTDPVAMLKVLVLAAQNNVADARMEYLIRDRRFQAAIIV